MMAIMASIHFHTKKCNHKTPAVTTLTIMMTASDQPWQIPELYINKNIIYIMKTTIMIITNNTNDHDDGNDAARWPVPFLHRFCPRCPGGGGGGFSGTLERRHPGSPSGLGMAQLCWKSSWDEHWPGLLKNRMPTQVLDWTTRILQWSVIINSHLGRNWVFHALVGYTSY